jgi:hypothetical protein
MRSDTEKANARRVPWPAARDAACALAPRLTPSGWWRALLSGHQPVPGTELLAGWRSSEVARAPCLRVVFFCGGCGKGAGDAARPDEPHRHVASGSPRVMALAGMPRSQRVMASRSVIVELWCVWDGNFASRFPSTSASPGRGEVREPTRTDGAAAAPSRRASGPVVFPDLPTWESSSRTHSFGEHPVRHGRMLPPPSGGGLRDLGIDSPDEPPPVR